MRELIKSSVGFSLAMSLLAMEQMRHMLRKKEDKEEKREDWIKEDLDAVADATGARFSDRTEKVFDAGNRFQREMIDMVFDIFKSDDAKPSRLADLAADMAEKSAEALRDAVKDDKKDKQGDADKTPPKAGETGTENARSADA